MKKRMVVLLVMLLTVASAFNVSALATSDSDAATGIDSNAADVSDSGAATEKEIRSGSRISYEEMVRSIAEKRGLDVDEVKREVPDLAAEKNSQTASGLRYNYFYLTDTVEVTDSYRPKVELYCMGWYNPDAITMKTGLVKVMNSSLHRAHNGKEKQFNGSVYAYMETQFRIHYSVSGDFYRNGFTELSDKAAVPSAAGEGTISSFVVRKNTLYSHYAHCNKKGYIYYGS